MNLPQEIESRVKKFVSELNELVRTEALRAVNQAWGGATRGVLTASEKSGVGAGQKPSSAAAKSGRGRARKKGEKRSAAQLASLETELLANIQNSPGQRMEQIGLALREATKDLARPAKKLIDAGKVRTEGEKRATRYFPGEAATDAAALAAPAKPAEKRSAPGAKKAPAKKASGKKAKRG